MQNLRTQGVYRYFLNNKPTNIIETFSIETRADGSRLVKSVRDAKDFGVKIFVEAVEKSENHFTHFEIRFLNANNAETSEVRAVYEFSGDELYFSRTDNGEKTANQIYQIPENCVVFPLMRVFQGKTILQIAENGQERCVLVPSIENPIDSEKLLYPIFDQRRAAFVGRENIAFYQENSTTFEAAVYRYFSKNYDEDSRFWIDEGGLLVAYRFVQSPDKIWEVLCTESSL